jgi:hypothetical protein
MSETIDKNLQTLRVLFEQVDEILDGWTKQVNLQVPVLLGMMAVRYNWDEKKVRENDPMVRFHLRNHPDWYVSRGAHGGIMPSSEKQKKDVALLTKASVKKQIQEVVEAKVASQNVSDAAVEDQEVRSDLEGLLQ